MDCFTALLKAGTLTWSLSLSKLSESTRLAFPKLHNHTLPLYDPSDFPGTSIILGPEEQAGSSRQLAALSHIPLYLLHTTQAPHRIQHPPIVLL